MQQNEFTVEDFVADDTSFLVEVNDRSGNALKSAQLKITVDDGDEQTVDPEQDGQFKIAPQPRNKLTISDVIGGEPEEKSFLLEVKDANGNNLQSAQLTVIVDDEDEQTIEAGDDGLFMIKPVPKAQLKITGIQ